MCRLNALINCRFAKIMKRIQSPYTAAITGCAVLYYEFKRILPLLLPEDSDMLLKDESRA